MADPTERFIAAATAPLADNAELQMTAEAELRQYFEGREIDGESWERTACILESRKQGKSPWFWLYVATALAALAVAALIALDFGRYREATDPFLVAYPSTFTAANPPGLADKLSREDLQLLFGEPVPGGLPQFEALWRDHPDDPVLFALYARSSWRPKTGVPPGILAEADRIDPRNSAFRVLAASVTARRAVTGLYQGSKMLPFKVSDAAAFDETLRLLKEAWQQPDYRSYQGELLARRLAILPAGDDQLGRSCASSLVSSWQPMPVPHEALGKVITNKAHELAAAGDTEGFRELCAIWEELVRRIARSSSGSPMEAIYLKRNLLLVGSHLARYAKQLQLEDLTSRFRALNWKLDELNRSWPNDSAFRRSSRNSAVADGILWMSPPHSRDPLPASDGELRPGRLAEHAFWARVKMYGMSAVMLCAALVFALTRFRHGHQARRLSASLGAALGPVDYAWIIGAGVVLPFLLHYGLENLTPMGGHAWGLDEDHGQHLRIATLFASIIILPCELAIRRLRRAYVLPQGPGFIMQLRWLLPVLLLCWLLGGIRGWREKPGWGDGWDILPVTLLVSFGIIALRGLFGVLLCQRHEALPPLVFCRALPPAFATAALLAIVVSFPLHAEERYWIKRDSFTRFEPGIPTGYHYSAAAQAQARADLLEALGEKP